MTTKPTILLYNITNPKRKNKIMSFCVMNGIKGKTVEKESYDKPLCELLGIESEAEKEVVEGDFSDEMLILCNLGVKFDRFLQFLRKEKVIIPLKAVLTSTNQNWNSVKVYEEIQEEHRMLAKK